jgi:hypothetical protein
VSSAPPAMVAAPPTTTLRARDTRPAASGARACAAPAAAAISDANKALRIVVLSSPEIAHRENTLDQMSA